MYFDRPPRTGNRPRPERTQRIVVCDYSGHPFQVQLSRELARRGHHVLHLYSLDFLTPHGALDGRPDDAANLKIEGLTIGEPHAKDSFIRRRRQEKRFGRLVAERALTSKPDAVLSCNLPLDAQAQLNEACRRHGVGFLFWLQDIYSAAISSILTRRFGLAGQLVGLYYRSLERRILERSEMIICISDDFLDLLRSWNIPIEKCIVIPNWGSLDAIHVEDKQNAWARVHNLHDRKVVLYSGTLGFKHNIELILTAATALQAREDIAFVIVSEGLRAERLQSNARERSLRNLVVLPFQPYDRYSEVLATADVLIAFIDNDAGTYSVPSKILSYLCAGRPIVLAAPERNLAAETVVKARAGVVVSADDATAFLQAIENLVNDHERRVECGRNARGYAEAHFDVRRVADRFEAVLASVDARSQQGCSGLGGVRAPYPSASRALSSGSSRADTRPAEGPGRPLPRS